MDSTAYVDDVSRHEAVYSPSRPSVVCRPRLIERLDEGLRRKLTLISAPAGFGKTTLLSHWLAGGARPTAWLSLDDGDSDPARFLVYLIAALQTIEATIGDGVSRALPSPQPPPTEAILTALLNNLTALRGPFVLIFDDYHCIAATPIDQILTYLVEHLPPHMHLVIATREEPRLPLARLRACDHLTELRAADLRFMAAEAVAFLSQVRPFISGIRVAPVRKAPPCSHTMTGSSALLPLPLPALVCCCGVHMFTVRQSSLCCSGGWGG